jgi:hypothetical protein
MRLHPLLYTCTGLLAGVGLTLTTVTTPAAAQQDAFLAAQKAQAIATIYQLDRSELHELEEALATGTTPAGALGVVRKAKAATMATDWPEPLHERAKQLANKLTALEEALRAEDAAKAAPLAKDAHDLEHDFSTAVYGWLAGGPAAAPAHGH